MNGTREEVRDRRARLWTWLIAEENYFSSRINFFLISETVMFAGLFQLLPVAEKNRGVMVLIGLVGALTSIVWAYSAWIQQQYTVKPLHIALRAIDRDMRDIHAQRGQVWWRVPISHLIGIWFPIALLFAWLAFFYLQYRWDFLVMLLFVSPSVALIGASILDLYHSHDPLSFVGITYAIVNACIVICLLSETLNKQLAYWINVLFFLVATVLYYTVGPNKRFKPTGPPPRRSGRPSA